MGVTFGTLIIVVVFSTGILTQVHKNKEKIMEAKLAAISCILLSMACFIIAHGIFYVKVAFLCN